VGGQNLGHPYCGIPRMECLLAQTLGYLIGEAVQFMIQNKIKDENQSKLTNELLELMNRRFNELRIAYQEAK
jgi:hypothetical protein